MNDGRCILDVKELCVMRAESVLCQGVSFCLQAGDICHIIGQNGLGKTTLMMQLVGVLPSLVGQIDYFGAKNAKGALYVSHQSGILDGLTVYENLAFLLSLYEKSAKRACLDEALSSVGLDGYGEMVCAKLSAGQKRRVALARLWLHQPDDAPLWILDEPLTALDGQMVAVLLKRLQDFAAAGGAVLLTSHQAIDIATKTLNLLDYVGEYHERF